MYMPRQYPSEQDESSKGLKQVLLDLHQADTPALPNPPGCKKRASVALILRIRPVAPDRVSSSSKKYLDSSLCFEERLDPFFAEDWVRRGDPEALFIKRAARSGDRWTGHVALPGGKREPNDADDYATSVRETAEEIGLNLDGSNCLPVGRLPDRVITTMWGKVPLMVLCPFVFLIVSHDLPPLALQPTEVSSVHWVSLRILTSSSLKCMESCDITERFLQSAAWPTKAFWRSLVGQLRFAATQLTPTESVYCNFTQAYESQRHPKPLILWGLTLGIMADLLAMTDPVVSSSLWVWPTLSHWDAHMFVLLFTYRFRKQKVQQMADAQTQDQGALNQAKKSDAAGFDTKTFAAASILRSGMLGDLLDGYFDRMRTAILMAFLTRLFFGIALAYCFMR